MLTICMRIWTINSKGEKLTSMLYTEGNSDYNSGLLQVLKDTGLTRDEFIKSDCFAGTFNLTLSEYNNILKNAKSQGNLYNKDGVRL